MKTDMTEPLETLRRLLRTVEAQLQAARTANGAALNVYTAERRELQSSVDVKVLRAAHGADRAEATSITQQIQQLDVRIRACGTTVIAAIAALSPERAPETYGRRGLVRESR